jgi:hypothetical protein
LSGDPDAARSVQRGEVMPVHTDYEFTLPQGYVDQAGEIHRQGTMRLATAEDEIEAVAHPHVQANEAYLPVVLLSRVITRLGSLTEITPQVVQGFYAADMAYLEDLYLRLNSYEDVLVKAVCPHCKHELHLKVAPLLNG